MVYGTKSFSVPTVGIKATCQRTGGRSWCFFSAAAGSPLKPPFAGSIYLECLGKGLDRGLGRAPDLDAVDAVRDRSSQNQMGGAGGAVFTFLDAGVAGVVGDRRSEADSRLIQPVVATSPTVMDLGNVKGGADAEYAISVAGRPINRVTVR